MAAVTMPCMLWELVGDGWRGHRFSWPRQDDLGALFLDGRVATSGTFEATLPEDRPFDRIVVSLNPHYAPDCWHVRVRVRAWIGEAWTPWAPLGVYGDGDELPRSEVGPDPAQIEVRLDTAHLPRPAIRAELRLEVAFDDAYAYRKSVIMGGGIPDPDSRGHVLVARVAVLTWSAGRRPSAGETTRRTAWGRRMDLPTRPVPAQLAWPGAIATVLGPRRAIAPDDIAQDLFDHGVGAPINPSIAVERMSSQFGFVATCARFDDLGPIEDEVTAGRPVIVAGSPDPAPLVVCGFTDTGDVVVSDPVRAPEPHVVARRDFVRRWSDDGDRLAWTFVAD